MLRVIMVGSVVAAEGSDLGAKGRLPNSVKRWGLLGCVDVPGGCRQDYRRTM